MNNHELNQLKQIEKNFHNQGNLKLNLWACMDLLKTYIKDLRYLPDGKIEGLQEVYKYINKIDEQTKVINNEQNHIRDKINLLIDPNMEFLFAPNISKYDFCDLPYKHWDKKHYQGGKPKSIKNLQTKENNKTKQNGF
jgi:hypothetical protein